jgi:hypothetical protein
MIWAAVDFAFVQNAGRKIPIIEVFHARRKNARNVEQNYSGKILIITSYLKKRKPKRIKITLNNLRR